MVEAGSESWLRRVNQRVRGARAMVALVAYGGVFAALHLAGDGLGWRLGWWLPQAFTFLLAVVVGLAVYASLAPRRSPSK